jgi:CheY-like chemotaxis protein
VRALIVDDEPSVCLLLSRILTRDFDCAAAEARNGREALALLSRENYDFVVLDLLMPVMGGLETLQSIRRSEMLQHLPVLVMSTVREEARVREAIGLGIGSYMAKPLRPTDVAARLARLMAGLSQASSGHATPRRCRTLQPGDRVLIVDDDREFRHFARAALAPDYSVATASGGAQGLRMAMQHPPGLILLGSRTGPLRPPVFVEKLRTVPMTRAVPVVAALAAPEDTPLAGADATIVRTLDTVLFRRQFDALLGLAAPDVVATADDAAPVRTGPRGLIVNGTCQVMSATFGLQVAENPAGAVATAGDEVAYIPMTMAQPACEYRLLLRASLDVARALATRNRPQTDVDDAAMASTLQQLVWMVGSRVLPGLHTGKTGGDLGEPASTCWLERDAARDGVTVAEVGFTTQAGDLPFSMLLRMLPRRSPSQAALLP